MADGWNIEIINGQAVQDFIKKLQRMLQEQQPTLFRSLGDYFVKDAQDRIKTSDNGAWAAGSKWLKAKTGQTKVLLGAEKYVRMSVTQQGLKILGKGGKWSLTQHHEGFTNQLTDPSEKFDEHGRVVIKLKDPTVLNLYTEFRKKRDGSVTPKSQVFAFVAKKAGVTPARKIWLNAQEAEAAAQPIISRWLGKVVADAGGSLVR